ncbi:MAG: putative manganese transporter [Bacteroidales bacterium]|nr:putative manganese transporter [Bacteroidales bacterium]
MLHEFLTEVVGQIVVITFFVLSMIMVLEYINVFSKGHVHEFMQRNKSLQILIAAFLGVVPGCIGTYTAVSLYTHNVIGFGALLANLIATTGDEAFWMMSKMPDKALLIFVGLFALSVVAGYVANIFVSRHYNKCGQEAHFVLHTSHDHHRHQSLCSNIVENFRHMSAHRLILLVSIIVFIVLTLCGFLGEHHHHGGEMHADEEEGMDFVSIISLVLAALSLYVVVRVPEHFLEDHIWHHVIGQHFWKILSWTSFALVLVFVINEVCDIDTWVKQFSGGSVYIFCMVAAILIGLIPESGPHVVFIMLYCNGVMPLGALIANCIVQDGHGAIPLFAESKKDFFVVKGIKVVLAIIIGAAMWWLN